MPRTRLGCRLLLRRIEQRGSGDGDRSGDDRAADQGEPSRRAGVDRRLARRRRPLRRPRHLRVVPWQDPRPAASDGVSGAARPDGPRTPRPRLADRRARGLTAVPLPRSRTLTMDVTVEERIRQEIADAPVVLYMKGSPVFPQCGFSAAVVQILSHIGVKFKGVDVLADPQIRQGIKEFSSWPTIPQLYVKGEFVGGCDIIREMFETGELQQLLEQKGVAVRA